MRRPAKLATAAFFGAVATFSSSEVFAYCSEPSAPSCASRFGEFDDEWEFDRCKREMESYKDDVERFIGCNNDEAEAAITKARDDNENSTSEYNDAVEAFNRRARGG
ncbi:hypothetical protein GR215_23150 [Rhizobium leguminosarum]|uniref:hypothetical protein n=1 Tax=Rhizobium leguminosarum TaxID=384 RepID=UPI0013BB739A|nr:hypothetical protein [Rhizobium leguminosarum]NEH44747.1 hypothetical protein [Rhizobium leguminosarum]